MDEWYLIVCDYYSKIPLFRMLPSMSSTNVISLLETIISEYGDIEEIIPDNGNQLKAKHYQTFAAQCGFNLTTKDPYYPKGNCF